MPFCKSAFSFNRTKPRKHVSRSSVKLPADQLYRDLGPNYEVIDVKVADKKIVFDIENGYWNTAGAESLDEVKSISSAQTIRTQVAISNEENNMLKLKIEVLLNLVAESVAEFSSAQR
ncbi:unnamed protein product [Rotaria magnacalcarata]|uniref:Uncharacterized protein n=1 Tax=Rotaria magnacalcarata TaxID=392030 RepID=A0A816KMY9_9BILA|nr:unnamed protein product [Rotaria magnacalcarata]CAF1662397.1 unnamed protein product [Rotaria magnacalcarata]CAF1923101.1 unnamed protein product [Rotaria magnacalcarata]CAF2035893.1 unnamed protein product [Rotaria magnacalcarata]CAF2119071.1 unnamed protein product [Rotaria magnacalcarata]